MRPDEFEFIAQAIKKRSGLALTQDKIYLLESRLQPIMRAVGCGTMSEFVNLLKLGAAEELYMEVTDAMTTNESMFFRDTKPFLQLRQVLIPKLLETHGSQKTIRVWSAACSNGQEAYSTIISFLEESHKLAGWNYDILGTDISPRVVDKAKQGIYSQFEVQRGLPIQMLLKYFKQIDNNNWQIHERLRQMVNFRLHNLLDDCSSFGRFDVVFCRNVLIYFDEPTKIQVLNKLASVMHPKGFLFLGASETILGLTTALKPLEGERGVYTLS